MCGIAGIISVKEQDVSAARLKQMTDAIAHRGPDGEQHWINETSHVGLGHRRLAIIDLSEAAAQPMHYSGRYTIVYNGEIYNYLELKEDLVKAGCHFSTLSDTEVILALYDRYKEQCLSMLDGMFAFAIYDSMAAEIFFARDRFGEKPLYYSYQPGKYFLFASEMKGLWAAGIPKTANKAMLYNYLSFGYLQNPLDKTATFFEDCHSLPHACFMKLSVADCTLKTPVVYYTPGASAVEHTGREEAVEKFSALFYTAVKRRLRSDVPVGSSLSGGIDSSLIVTVIDQLLKGKGQPQKTFSAVFPGFEKDESRFMKMVGATTQTEPHYIFPTAGGLLQHISTVCYHQEEPFTSSSVYAQYCVMEDARRNNVTVLLDGQGADEYLAGYPFFLTAYFNDLKKNHPQLYHQEYADYTRLHRSNDINGLLKKDTRYYIRSFAPGLVSALKNTRAAWKQQRDPFFASDFFAAYKNETYHNKADFSSLNMALQQAVFDGGLQSLLRYADRNSMAHGREVRLPFLFHEIVDFVLSLPPHYKIHNGWTKWIMREAFKELLPPEIAWRKDKIGYEPPQQQWLQEPEMKDLVHFSKEKLYKAGIISRRQLDGPVEATEAINDKSRTWALIMAGVLC